QQHILIYVSSPDRYMLYLLDIIFCPCSFNGSYNGSLSALAGFAAYDGVEFAIAKTGFIDTQLRGYIVREYSPVLRMRFLVPVMKVAQVILILILELFAIQLEQKPQKMGTDRIVIQISPLKKARI